MAANTELSQSLDINPPDQSEYLRAVFVVVEMIKHVRSLICEVDKKYLPDVLAALDRAGLPMSEEEIGEGEENPETLVKKILLSVERIFDNEHVLPRHLPAVGNLSRAIGAELGLDPEICELLFRCGACHDVGKIDPIVDSLISEERKLTHEEKYLTQPHAAIGSMALEILGSELQVIQAARSHHERLDQSGYPDRLSAEKISFLTRIVSVADNVDAMFDDRPGRETRSLAYVMNVLREGVESFKLDSVVVEAFFRICEKAGYVEGDKETDTHIKTPQLLKKCGIVLA
jgi:HD-GYP domain-containing protein (c-di-GMP phosphodiesterase class II)